MGCQYDGTPSRGFVPGPPWDDRDVGAADLARIAVSHCAEWRLPDRLRNIMTLRQIARNMKPFLSPA